MTSQPNYEDSLVSVSIVTWNHAHFVEKCIESVLRQSHKNLEVIVSDNHSQDETLTTLQRYAPRISLRINEANLGFSAAQNNNIRSAKGEFVLLANPDVVFQEDYIAQALKVFATDEKVGAVCGVLYNRVDNLGKRILDGVGLQITRSRRFGLIAHELAESDLPDSNFEIFGSDGAAPMYRRAMIEDISVDGRFFDEMFFAHKEDHDVAWRARLLGWKAVCGRGCLAFHPRSFKPGDLDLRRQMSPETKFHAVKNQFLLILNNEHLMNFILDSPWILTRQVATFVYSAMFERSSLKAYKFILENIKRISDTRRNIKGRRTVSWSEIRRWIREPVRSISQSAE